MMGARVWGLMTALWGLEAMVRALFHLGVWLTPVEAPMDIPGTHPPYTHVRQLVNWGGNRSPKYQGGDISKRVIRQGSSILYLFADVTAYTSTYP